MTEHTETEWHVVKFQDGTYGIRKSDAIGFVFYTRSLGPHTIEVRDPALAYRCGHFERADEQARMLKAEAAAARIRATDYGTPV